MRPSGIRFLRGDLDDDDLQFVRGLVACEAALVNGYVALPPELPEQ
jgi:hypothetical protein